MRAERLRAHLLARHAIWRLRPAGLEVLQPQALKSQVGDELCTVNEITPPQTAGLLQKTEGPFQTVFAHPAGSLFPSSRKHVKRRADAHHHGDAQPVLVLVHPALLLWRPQSHPEHIRRSAAYHLHYFFIFVCIQPSIGWRVRSNDVQPRGPSLEPFRKALGDAGFRSVEKMAVT